MVYFPAFSYLSLSIYLPFPFPFFFFFLILRKFTNAIIAQVYSTMGEKGRNIGKRIDLLDGLLLYFSKLRIEVAKYRFNAKKR